MLSNEYKVNESEKCIYYKNGNNMQTICEITFGSKIHVANYVKSLFINNIDKKDLDKVEVILGFKITRSEKRTFLTNLIKLRRS